jgi:superfamily II DNA helicase RecQ
MQDQVSSLLSRGVHASYISSALSDKDRTLVLQSLNSSPVGPASAHPANFPSLLYITPELLQTRCLAAAPILKYGQRTAFPSMRAIRAIGPSVVAAVKPLKF